MFRNTRNNESVGCVDALESRVLLAAATSDTYYGYQWGLHNASAASAWSATTGSYSVVVSDNDSGVDYTHPDLYLNIWINQAEIPAQVKAALTDVDADGLYTFKDLNDSANADAFGVNDLNANGYIDGGDLLKAYKDDGSGGWADKVNGATWTGETAYVDDIIGWDFAHNDNDPMDHDGHGTHTAGIIGAVGNNGLGVSGVNQAVSIMPVKIFADSGSSASITGIAAAIKYSAAAGADISNNSWGTYSGSNGDKLYQAIKYAANHGQLFVAAAGNNAVNNDMSPYRSFPASYDLANIVSVAAIGQSSSLAYYSNYGRYSVDIAAPGTSVLSTLPNGQYGYMSGTSMASPFVAGAAALLLAQSTTRTAAQLKSLLLNTVDRSPRLSAAALSGGKLNLSNALNGRTTTNTTTSPPVVRTVPFRRMIIIFYDLAEPARQETAVGSIWSENAISDDWSDKTVLIEE